MLSDNIRCYRKENNLSQDELAEKLGVSRQSISLWETGQTQPTIDNIIALAKIFNISTDALLGNTGSTSDIVNRPQAKMPAVKKKSKAGAVTAIIIVAAIIIGIAICFLLVDNDSGKAPAPHAESSSVSETADKNAPQAASGDVSNESVESTVSVKSEEPQNISQAESLSADDVPSKTDPKTGSKTDSGSAPVKGDESAVSVKPKEPHKAEDFDLFSYCRDYAIKRGELNGDCCIYRQPATRYGGYNNEYFLFEYWAGYNKVELCLHCPLNETFSISFSLIMRGGYDKKYEYVSSRYYRDTGNNLQYATGYIDPAVFSDHYPLSCDTYMGDIDRQTDFMEESRVGICDLIHCLKNFVVVEKLECGFSAFDFVNF